MSCSFCELAKTRATDTQIERLGILKKEEVQNKWESTSALRDSPIGLGNFQVKKADIFRKDYAVLEGFADFVVRSAPARFLDALGRSATFSRQTFA